MESKNSKLEIAIIGVGFTGMMTAVHLIRKANSPLTLFLINDKYDFGKGPAYSTTSPKHILNVPAAKMSAFPDQPYHFLEWAHRQEAFSAMDKDILGRMFMPRQYFGKYISDIWNETVSNKRSDTEINIIHAKATDIHLYLSKQVITLSTDRSISADYVILATGNERPKDIPVSDISLYNDPNYIGEPWGDNATQGMDLKKDILILGNGLTMVDTVLNILDQDYQGVIHTVSPDGLAIAPHRYGYIPYTKMAEELQLPYHVKTLYSLINKHVKALLKAGLSAEPVIDSLRPHTQKIWQALSGEDKQRFLKYHVSHWNQQRHRMPAHMYDYLIKLQLEGKLVIHKGRVRDLKKTKEGITAEILEKNQKDILNLPVSRVISCIGPHTNVGQSTTPLFQKLTEKGVLQADPQKLGMHVTDRWTLINALGQEIPSIYAIGGNLKGLLWESTAVPELRGQAEKIAIELIAKANR